MRTPPEEALLFADDRRREVLERACALVDEYLQSIAEQPVSRAAAPKEVRAFVEALSFDVPKLPTDALEHLAEGLRRYQVHTPHPRYFGLFNPAPSTMGIAGDMLAAAFNPQLATWSHSPMACEVERYLCRALGERFGYDRTEGTFTSGGAEANHTAILVALAQRFPELAGGGLRALSAQPVFYVSAESHHSLHKAARLCGLGEAAVRTIAVDSSQCLIPEALEAQIAGDRAAGLAPFLVVATAGTTNTGAIDPLAAVADIAAREDMWFHVDAAWGGGAAFIPELAPLLSGVERSDSLTFDAHKWLSVPMGAGLFLTRQAGALSRTFATRAPYMPRPMPEASDPYGESMQWSRRFMGAKLYLSLAVAGWEGYATALGHQVHMADRLRRRLQDERWRIVNETRLPIVCFDDPTMAPNRAVTVASWVQRSGQSWISSTRIDGERAVLRACITHAGTGRDDVDALVDTLRGAKKALGHG